MNIIICGSREIENQTKQDIDHLVSVAQFDTINKVLCGEATGIDQLGKRWALKHEVEVESYPADWKAHGKAAGPIRNGQMVKEADGVIAIMFPDSRGTKDCIRQATSKGITVIVKVLRRRSVDNEYSVTIITNKNDHKEWEKSLKA